jgi:hypothetical protein
MAEVTLIDMLISLPTKKVKALFCGTIVEYCTMSCSKPNINHSLNLAYQLPVNTPDTFQELKLLPSGVP